MVSRSQPTAQPLSHYIQPIFFCLNHPNPTNPFRYGGKYPLFHPSVSNQFARFAARNRQKQHICLHRIFNFTIWRILCSHASWHIPHCDDFIQNPHNFSRLCLSRPNTHRHPSRHSQHNLPQNHISPHRIFLSREKGRHHQPHD